MLLKCAAVALLMACATPVAGASVEWSGARHGATLPAQVSQNVMFAQLSVRGATLRFLVDTGASTSVLDSDTAARLELKPSDSQSMATSGAAVAAGHLDALELTAPGVAIRGVPFVVTSLAQMSVHFGRQVDGILGYDFLAPLAVTFDFASHELRLNDASVEPTATGFACLPLQIRARQPYASATIIGEDGARVAGHFMVDTGASGTLQLEGGVATHPALHGAAGVRRDLGHGVGGDFGFVWLPVAAVRVGPYELRRPKVAWLDDTRSDRGDGLLGGAILRRFTLVVSYSRKLMCLRPNAEIAREFTTDLAGLTPIWPGPDLRPLTVGSVAPESPAARAGLRPGDVIESIDGRPGGSIDVDELAQLLRAPGALYEFQVRRGQSLMELHLELPAAEAPGLR